jgi:hypothetical protein
MTNKTTVAMLLIAVGLPVAVEAQAKSAGPMTDLVAQVASVETKIVALAKAIPESAYDWRPGADVRSVSEVFRHVAGENLSGPKSAASRPQPTLASAARRTTKPSRTKSEK